MLDARGWPRPGARLVAVVALLCLPGAVIPALAQPDPGTLGTWRPPGESTQTDRTVPSGKRWSARPRHRTTIRRKPRTVTASVTRGRGLTLAWSRTTETVTGVRSWTFRVRSAQPLRATVSVRVDGATVATDARRVSRTWTRLTLRAPTTVGQSLALRVRFPRATRAHEVRVTHVTSRARATVGTSSRFPVATACAIDTRGLVARYCGGYLGQAYGSNTDPADIEQRTGAPLGVRRTYWRADQVASALRVARADVDSKRLPWLSFKLPGGWQAMAEGRHDAWVQDLAARLDQVSGPVWVAFHHEPEGDEPDISWWRRMQERLAPVVRRDNVAFTVVLTGWNQLYGRAEYSLDNIWPRGVEVDVAGFDVYNSLGTPRGTGINTVGNSMDRDYFSHFEAWANTHDVQWAIAETGLSDYAMQRDPEWIQRTHAEMVARGGLALTYFNTTLNSVSTWRFNADKEAAYRATVPQAIALG